MSIINDALKKAQRERTGGSDPSALRTGSGRGGSGGSPGIWIGAGLALVAVAIVAVGALFAFRRPAPAAPVIATAQPPQPTVATTAPAPAQVPTPAPAKPTTQTPAAPEPKLVTVHTEPAAPAGQFQLSAPNAKPSSTPASKPATVAETASAPATPAGPPEDTAGGKMIDIVENLHVAGIRASGADSKVLMNDRVYRLNDVVDHDHGIRLIGVETNALTFRNAKGEVYTRHF